MIVRIIQIARLLIILASRHRSLVFENLALRQQLAVYHRTRPKPTVRWSDRLFWVGLRLAWPDWKSALVIIRPATVIAWHRRGFAWYWTQTWRTFLENHLDSTVAIDFFAVPTLTGQILFVLVVLAHDRRHILQVNVTDHPTSAWARQQLREAFPFDAHARFLLHDRDTTSRHRLQRTAPSSSPSDLRRVLPAIAHASRSARMRRWDAPSNRPAASW